MSARRIGGAVLLLLGLGAGFLTVVIALDAARGSNDGVGAVALAIPFTAFVIVGLRDLLHPRDVLGLEHEDATKEASRPRRPLKLHR